MERRLYTAQARVVGGRSGRGRTSDGALEVELRRPPEMGGPGGGTNPEQLFAIGYAACFDGALGAAARRARVKLSDVVVDARVMLIPTTGRRYKLRVELHVSLPTIDDPRAAAVLVRSAHEICPYSNATRGNIDVALTANGTAVA